VLVGRPDHRAGPQRRDGRQLDRLEARGRLEQPRVDGQQRAGVDLRRGAEGVAAVLRRQAARVACRRARLHHVQQERLQLRAREAGREAFERRRTDGVDDPVARCHRPNVQARRGGLSAAA